jgi:ferric-dicitrate binding protein FerR (iron transport regulator)
MSNDHMDDHLDQLIHATLEEELGNQTPPDLSSAIMEKARMPKNRPSLTRHRQRTLLAIAATVFVSVAGIAFWLLVDHYPNMQMTGIEAAEGKDGVYLATNEDAKLSLGGYCHITPTKGTTFKLEGKPNSEKIFLLSGDVRCRVDKKKKPKDNATFEVQTHVGVVRVTGTEFTVGIIEEQNGDKKMKRMLVKVFAGSVIVVGSWGNVALSAEGLDTKVFDNSPTTQQDDRAPKQDAKKSSKWTKVSASKQYKKYSGKETTLKGKLVQWDDGSYRLQSHDNLTTKLVTSKELKQFNNKQVELKGTLLNLDSGKIVRVGSIRLQAAAKPATP